MKICNNCNVPKTNVSFFRQQHAKDGRKATCKECLKVSNAEYNRTHPQQAESARARKTVLRQWVLDYKGYQQCLRCGFDNPAALQFHHRDPAQKLIAISQAAVRGWSKKRILIEIEKCDILCANCHCIEHFSRAVSVT